MINLLDIIPRLPADGDTISIEDVEFSYNAEKNWWTHDEFDESQRFDYQIYIVYGTVLVCFKKTLIDQKNWWFKIIS